MASEIGVTDYIVILLMLLISIGIGIYFKFSGTRQRTLHEYLLAGKNMAVFPVACSIMASFMSTTIMIGIPADIYLYGIQVSLSLIGIVIAGIIAAYLYMPVFYDMNVATAYEYLEKRFGKTTRLLVSIMFCIQTLLYMGVTFFAPCISLQVITGISYTDSIIILTLVSTLYCSVGGLKAVVWTDVLQASLMIISVILVAIKGSINVGGASKLFQIAKQGGRLEFFNFSTLFEYRFTFWNTIIPGVIGYLSLLGANQTEIQRMLSVRSKNRAKRALLYSLPLVVIFCAFCDYNGLVLYGLFHDCDPIMRKHKDIIIRSPNQLIPYTIIKLFKHIPGLSGLCVAGIFSASMSTVSSGLNALASVVAKDFIEPHVNRIWAEKWMPLIVKFLVAGLGGLCLLVSLGIRKFHSIFEAATAVITTISGPILGVFSIGIFTTTGNEIGTIIGLVIGVLINVWMAVGSAIYKPRYLQLTRNITGCPEYPDLQANGSYSNSFYSVHDNMSYYIGKNKNISSFYKVSFLWYSVIGCFTVFIISYICSFIKRKLFEENVKVRPEYISPILRKWYFPSMVKRNVRHDLMIEMVSDLKAKDIGKFKKYGEYQKAESLNFIDA